MTLPRKRRVECHPWVGGGTHDEAVAICSTRNPHLSCLSLSQGCPCGLREEEPGQVQVGVSRRDLHVQIGLLYQDQLHHNSPAELLVEANGSIGCCIRVGVEERWREVDLLPMGSVPSLTREVTAGRGKGPSPSQRTGGLPRGSQSRWPQASPCSPVTGHEGRHLAWFSRTARDSGGGIPQAEVVCLSRSAGPIPSTRVIRSGGERPGCWPPPFRWSRAL